VAKYEVIITDKINWLLQAFDKRTPKD